MELPRINQYLVTVGLAKSRRKADEIIKQGRVKVNGSTLTDLSFRVAPSDTVLLDDQAGQIRSDIYIVYNKPVGQICSHQHQGQSPTVFDALPKNFASLKIAGRLDKDSRGLIILSSDGQFVQQLSHPGQGKVKTYIVKTKQTVAMGEISALNHGVILDDGKSNLKVNKIKSNTLRIEMKEGRKRQIRRSLESVKLDVIDLERVGIGTYSNPHLPEGKFDFIMPEDVL